MSRIGTLSILVAIPTVFALARGFLGDDESARAPAPAIAGSQHPEKAPGPLPDQGERVWIAIDFVDQEAGGSSEYLGSADRSSLEELLDGRLEGYLRLDQVYWLYDDGEVERLDEDIAYEGSAYFRADSIRRVTPLKDGFPEATRNLAPGDRIVPSAGRDA